MAAENKLAFSHRNLAIDMLRALTMFTMIFVNDFWKVHDVPAWLNHAKAGEDYLGLADFVLPTFLFVVGMSIPYAIERRYAKGYSEKSTLGHILLRTLALLIMGVCITNSEPRLAPDFGLYRIGVYWFIMAVGFIGLWNAYPKDPTPRQKCRFTAFKIIGAGCLLFLAFTYRGPGDSVFRASWGILGNIGWTYLFCATVYFFCRNDLKKLIPIWCILMVIYLTGTPLREAFGGQAIIHFPRPNFYDSMLSTLHIGKGSSVLFALSGLILSLLSEKYVSKNEGWKLGVSFAAAAVFLSLGFFARKYWIATKIGGTPPWFFYVLAEAVALYAILNSLVRHGITGWFKLIKPAGTATLTTYLVPYIFYGLADVTGVVLPDWFTHGGWSIVNCLCFTFVVIAVAGIMEKLHIKLKI